MKRSFFIITILSAIAGGIHAQNADSLKAVQQLDRSARKMSQHFVDTNYAEYIRFIHPALIRSLGGEQKMIAVIRKTMQEMKDEGFTISQLTMGKCSGIHYAGSEYQAIVPQILTLTAGGKQIVSTTYLVAISNDKGATWLFLDSSGKSVPELRKLVPSLSDLLVIPAKKDPVVTDI